jgi:NADPH:quinone reductase-like Zn-dependent oxidoreductase
MLARTTERISALLASGAIRPHVGAVFPFDKLPDALAAMGERGTTGKVILKTTSAA